MSTPNKLNFTQNKLINNPKKMYLTPNLYASKKLTEKIRWLIINEINI